MYADIRITCTFLILGLKISIIEKNYFKASCPLMNVCNK